MSKHPIQVWAGGEQEDRAVQIRYPVYRPSIPEFMRDLRELLNLWRPCSYLNDVARYRCARKLGLSASEFCERADSRSLKALLTYVCRTEKFCEGSLTGLFEEGLIEALLVHLKGPIYF